MAPLRSSKANITGWLGIIATALAGLCIVALFQARGSHRDTNNVKVHYVNIVALKDSQLLQVNAQDRLRAYLLTGSLQDLARFNDASAPIEAKLKDVQRATRGDGKQFKRAGELQQISMRNLETLQAAAKARQTRGQAAAVALLQQRAVPATSQTIEKMVALMEETESAKLQVENAEVKNSIDYVLSFYSLLVLLIFALLILVFFLINYERTARRKYEGHMEDLASTDALTGLKNRRAFEARLAEEFERSARNGNPVSLIMLDVDRFKNYNDSYGHPAGDEVLKTVGRILRENTRASDFPARFGGEEFAIIAPETAPGKVATLGERIRTAIENEPWPERTITASLGIATISPEPPHGNELLEAADKALYEAKQAGRNRVVYSTVAAPAAVSATATAGK